MPDLHVDNQIATLRENPLEQTRAVDPYDETTFFGLWLTHSLPHELPPSAAALLSTKEVVKVPPKHLGNIYLRSTFARLGIVCPSTVADPGFEGTLTLEIFNASNRPLLIRPNDALFHWILSPCEGEEHYMLKGRYQGQRGITLPKALKREDKQP